MINDHDPGGQPLADVCSLCSQGYYPTMEIDIADEPMDGEYRWCHVQCKRDHGRVFYEAFGDRWDDAAGGLGE